MKKKFKTIYVLSPKIKWKTFKLLQNKLVRDSGPVPISGDKCLWELLREEKIYCWFCDEMAGDMGVGVELPNTKEIQIIS